MACLTLVYSPLLRPFSFKSMTGLDVPFFEIADGFLGIKALFRAENLDIHGTPPNEQRTEGCGPSFPRLLFLY